MQHRSSPAYVGLTVLWGLSFVLVSAVVDGFGWAPAVSLSCLLIGATVAVLAVLKGATLRYRLRWKRLLLMGVGIAVQLIGLTIAISHLGTALAAAAVGTVPLFAAVIGQMWGLERITGTAAAGLVRRAGRSRRRRPRTSSARRPGSIHSVRWHGCGGMAGWLPWRPRP